MEASSDSLDISSAQLRSVDDMVRNESACLACCRDKELDLILSERGIVAGTSLRLCWRSTLSGVLCVEASRSRFSLRRSEAKAMILHD